MNTTVIMPINKKGFISRYYPWLIWALGASFFLAEYFVRISPSVMVPQLMRDFQVNSYTLGALSGYFYAAYLFMQLPVGILVDKFSARRLLCITAAICAVGCFLFAGTHSLLIAKLSRLLIGFSAAFAFVGTLKIATHWLPGRFFGLVAGMTQALGMLGAGIGGGPVEIAIEKIGWRQTLHGMGIILVVIAILIGLLVRDKKDAEGFRIKEPGDNIPLLKGLLIIFKNPQTWINAIYVGFLFAPTTAFGELWGTTYLANVHHLDVTTAASGISMMFLGWGVGGPVFGWLSDHMQKRKPLMIASAVLSMLWLSLALYVPMNTTFLYLILFLYGFSNVGTALAYAVAKEINPGKVCGTSMSFANLASVIIGACFQPLLGYFLDTQKHQVINHIQIYSPQTYQHAFIILPLCFIISIVMTFFLKESYSAD